MNKSTKIIIALEVVALLFLVAAIVISIIKGHWFQAACTIIWIYVAAMILVVAVRHDNTIQEKEELMAENADLRKENDILHATNQYLKSRCENIESGDKTVRWFKDRFVELALQMENRHGEAKEIRISPCFHTKKVEIDF